MRRLWVLSTAVTLTMATACTSSVDVEAIDVVEVYVVSQADATSAVLAGDTSEEALSEVESLNDDYWSTDQWPDKIELREWTWTREVDGQTYHMDGQELADVASDLEDYSGHLVWTLREGGDVTYAEMDAQTAVDAAWNYFDNQ